MTKLTAGLDQVLAEISQATREAGRAPGAVELTIASKTQPTERILPLLNAGHRRFGENRVQEAQGKWPALKEEFPDIELHMIGPLQSNKAEDAVRLFDVIETVDRISLVRALQKAMTKVQKRPKLFIEVNIGDEPQKAGVKPDAVDDFIATCRDEYHLTIEGLMCIPPNDKPPAPFFARLATMAARNNIRTLSMGMSSDFPIAINEGATHVRVGTAVFGARQ